MRFQILLSLSLSLSFSVPLSPSLLASLSKTHQAVSLCRVQISGNHSQRSCLDEQPGETAGGIPNKAFLDRLILLLGRPQVMFHTKPSAEVLSVNSDCRGTAIVGQSCSWTWLSSAIICRYLRNTEKPKALIAPNMTPQGLKGTTQNQNYRILHNSRLTQLNR